MKFNPKSILLALLSTLLCATAFAANGQWNNVTVVGIIFYSPEGSPANTVLVELSGTSSGGPSCASNNTYVAVDTSTAAGAIAVQVFQYARITGNVLVGVRGTGACSIVGNIETLYQINE